LRKPYFCAVIGKGFGDEGKGMAVDFLASGSEKILVIRHNGGAQSGHTVDLPDRRFVFHELSSGSFQHADTFWADTYFPDLYKLGDELSDFRTVAGFVPDIYSDSDTKVTIIDDVLLNMASEEARGINRHGSCGMGIYEAQCRTEAGFSISIGELMEYNEEELYSKLQWIREKYLPLRIMELGLSETELGEYGEMLQSNQVLKNQAEEMLNNIKNIRVIRDLSEYIPQYGKVIFENGQGLLLDSENEKYSPHVTASRTGLTNPCCFLKQFNYTLDEVIYVTRSYVTRHGAGPLPNECKKEELGIVDDDQTNIENPWQGCIRYARHERQQGFVEYIEEDIKNIYKYNMPLPICSLLITHLNETNNMMISEDKDYYIEDFSKLKFVNQRFNRLYFSASKYAQDIKRYDVKKKDIKMNK